MPAGQAFGVFHQRMNTQGLLVPMAGPCSGCADNSHDGGDPLSDLSSSYIILMASYVSFIAEDAVIKPISQIRQVIFHDLI